MKLYFARSVVMWLMTTLLLACGGGSSVDPASTVSGVAASGLAIQGSVTLKDATGAIRTAAIAQPGGEFSVDVSGLAPPFFLKAADSTGAVTLYSVSTGAGNFNINPLSNLVVLAAAMAIDPLSRVPAAAFNNPAAFANLTAAQVQAATASVMARMSPAFQAALGANSANGVNPLTDRFQVGKGLDKVFDAFAITVSPATYDVQERQVAGNTSTSLGLVDSLGRFPAAGIYDGTVTMPSSPGGSHSVHDAMITPTGELRYVLDNGVQVIAALKADGSTVTGTGKAFAPPPGARSGSVLFADGSAAVNLVFNGTLGAGTLSGSYSYGNHSDAFSLTLNAQASSASASLAKIAGTYASSVDSSTEFIGHIEPNGTIWGSGPGIEFSGLIQVVDPKKNIYRVTLAYSGGGCGYQTGLAIFHESSSTTDELPMPTATIADGDPVDVANLVYSQSVAGSHGKLVIQLSNPTNPANRIVLNAVRLSPQLQTVVAEPAPDSLILQVIGSPAFSLNLTGNAQYSESSSERVTYVGGSINLIGGTLNLFTAPGRVVLNGATINFLAPSNLAGSCGCAPDGSDLNSGALPTGHLTIDPTQSNGGSLNLGSGGAPMASTLLGGLNTQAGGGTINAGLTGTTLNIATLAGMNGGSPTAIVGVNAGLTQTTGGSLSLGSSVTNASGAALLVNLTLNNAGSVTQSGNVVLTNGTIAVTGANGAAGANGQLTVENCNQNPRPSCAPPQLP